MIAIVVFASIAIYASASGRVKLESDVSTFSSPLWNDEGSAALADIINAIFVLKRDPLVVRTFEEKLLDLATPSSPNYGKWLTKEQVIAEMAPPQESVQTVVDFIQSFNVLPDNIRVSDFRDKVFVKLPATVAADMLNTRFNRFRSLEDRNIVLVRATQSYSLPEEVASVVELVDDILRFPSIRRSHLNYFVNSTLKASSPFNSCGTSCSGFTTPDVLEQAYSFSPISKATSGNSMSVAEFQYQYYDNADLQSFSKSCDVTATVDTTVGGNVAAVCNIGCVEALLDIEYIEAVANPIPLTVIYSSTYSLLDWVDGLISMKNPPLVNSVSYGNDEVQQTSTAYMQQCNTQFMMAGSMGLSLLFAAGDQGVWGRTGVGATFNPDFPAGSPYVTAVGGTNFATKSVIGEESAWSCGGGGFSTVFTIPSWQQTQVSNYLTVAAATGVLPKSSFFNAAGRAYPDISALGGEVNPYCVAVGGGSKLTGVYGTSASTPVVSGIFAQLNNVRLSKGKTALGWLNPFIYANPQCFQDINDGSQNNCVAGTQGFAALNGWDPATGNGSPNYACLAKLM
jgi:tripeptidyl-peptidase-1